MTPPTDPSACFFQLVVLLQQGRITLQEAELFRSWMRSKRVPASPAERRAIVRVKRELATFRSAA